MKFHHKQTNTDIFPHLSAFCIRKMPVITVLILFRFELAMQQNEIMNVFFDDWMALADDDGSFGSKADNHLKV